MSLATKLALLALAAVGWAAMYEWELATNQPRETTQAALRQFENSDAAAQELRVVDAGKHWWALGGGAGLALLAAAVCWEDVRRWASGAASARR